MRQGVGHGWGGNIRGDLYTYVVWVSIYILYQ